MSEQLPHPSLSDRLRQRPLPVVAAVLLVLAVGAGSALALTGGGGDGDSTGDTLAAEEPTSAPPTTEPAVAPTSASPTPTPSVVTTTRPASASPTPVTTTAVSTSARPTTAPTTRPTTTTPAPTPTPTEVVLSGRQSSVLVVNTSPTDADFVVNGVKRAVGAGTSQTVVFPVRTDDRDAWHLNVTGRPACGIENGGGLGMEPLTRYRLEIVAAAPCDGKPSVTLKTNADDSFPQVLPPLTGRQSSVKVRNGSGKAVTFSLDGSAPVAIPAGKSATLVFDVLGGGKDDYVLAAGSAPACGEPSAPTTGLVPGKRYFVEVGQCLADGPGSEPTGGVVLTSGTPWSQL